MSTELIIRRLSMPVDAIQFEITYDIYIARKNILNNKLSDLINLLPLDVIKNIADNMCNDPIVIVANMRGSPHYDTIITIFAVVQQICINEFRGFNFIEYDKEW